MRLFPFGRSSRDREIQLAQRLDKYIELSGRWHSLYLDALALSDAKQKTIDALSGDVARLTESLADARVIAENLSIGLVSTREAIGDLWSKVTSAQAEVRKAKDSLLFLEEAVLSRQTIRSVGLEFK